MKWWHLPPLPSISKHRNSPKSVFMFSTSFLWTKCFELIYIRQAEYRYQWSSQVLWWIWTYLNVERYHSCRITSFDAGLPPKILQEEWLLPSVAWRFFLGGGQMFRTSVKKKQDISGTWIYLIYLQIALSQAYPSDDYLSSVSYYIAFANYRSSQELLESSWQLWRNQRKGRKTLQPTFCVVFFSLTAARELCTSKVAVTTMFCGVLNGGRFPIFPRMLP